MTKALKTRLSGRALNTLTAGQLAWDTEVSGFGARMGATGKATMFLNYQVRGTGRFRRHSIGKTGELSVDAARKIAAEMKLSIRAGHDPAAGAETAAAKKAAGDTIAELAERWLTSPKHGWRPSTRAGYASAFKRNLMQTDVATMRIGEVTRADLMRTVDAATDRSPSAGALYFRTLNSFLGWCDDRGFTEITLPRAGRAAPAPSPRTRVMSDDEIRALFKAADGLRTPTAVAGRLVLLTGLRTGAAQALQRDWIRQDGITIPGEAMKGGRDFWIPLTSFTRDQLEPVMERIGPVFGANTSRLKQAWPTWRKLAGVDPDLRLHDTRRSLKTWAARENINDLHSEAALGHVVQKTALDRAYQQHGYAAEAGEVLRRWQNHVEGLVA